MHGVGIDHRLNSAILPNEPLDIFLAPAHVFIQKGAVRQNFRGLFCNFACNAPDVSPMLEFI